MNKLLALCLLFGTQVFAAEMPEHQTKSLYEILPSSVLRIVCGYMRNKIDRHGFAHKVGGRIHWMSVQDEEGHMHAFVDQAFFSQPIPTLFSCSSTLSIAVMDQNGLRAMNLVGDGEYGGHLKDLREKRAIMCGEYARRHHAQPNVHEEAERVADAWYKAKKKKLGIDQSRRLAEAVGRGEASFEEIAQASRETLPSVEEVYLAKENYGWQYIVHNEEFFEGERKSGDEG